MSRADVDQRRGVARYYRIDRDKLRGPIEKRLATVIEAWAEDRMDDASALSALYDLYLSLRDYYVAVKRAR